MEAGGRGKRWCWAKGSPPRAEGAQVQVGREGSPEGMGKREGCPREIEGKRCGRKGSPHVPNKEGTGKGSHKGWQGTEGP